MKGFFYAHALKTGLLNNYPDVRITSLQEIQLKECLPEGMPLIVIGFLKDFMKFLTSDAGSLKLFNRYVTGLFNDSLVLAVNNKFKKICTS